MFSSLKGSFSFSIRRRSSSLFLSLARRSWSCAFFLGPLNATGRSIMLMNGGREDLIFSFVCVAGFLC